MSYVQVIEDGEAEVEHVFAVDDVQRWVVYVVEEG